MPLEIPALDAVLDEWLGGLSPAARKELSAGMIVNEETLTALAERIRERFGVSGVVRQAALRASVREAEHLAEDMFEAPAALVYALARNRSVFAAFAPMVVAAAFLQARASGLRLSALPKSIADMAEAVTASDMSYEDVRAFFASETFPLGRVDC